MKTTGWLASTGLMAAAAMAITLGCGDDEGSNPSTGGTGGAAGQAGSAGNAGEGGGRKLMLLYTSDEHSDLLGHSPERDDYPIATTPGAGNIIGGVARRATLLAEVRAEAAAANVPTMTVSAGDNAMGTMTQIVHDSASLEWRLMSRLGYDMTTLGNHDFDLSLTNLVAALDTAKNAGELPGIVSSNIHFSDSSPDDDTLEARYATDPAADAAIHSYRVLEADNGLRVGFIGIVGVDASVKAPFKAPIQFSEAAVNPTDAEDPEMVLPHLYEDLQPVVDKLRNEEDVDLVVALSHSGLLPTEPENSEDDRIAANVAGIDVIVSGHHHQTGEAPVVVKNETTGKDVLILNGGAHGAFVGRIELTVPSDASQAITYDEATQGLMAVTNEIVADAPYAAMVDEAIETIESSGDVDGKSALEHLLNQSLGTSLVNDSAVPGDLYFHELATTTYDLSTDRQLSFLTSDAHVLKLDELGQPVDFAMQSGGVVRSALLVGETGAITVGDAYRVVPLGSSPFDGTTGYPLVRVKIPIGAVRIMFEFASGRGQTDGSFNLVGSGLVADYDCSREPITSIAAAFVPENGRVMKLWMDSDHSDGLEQFDTLVWDRENPPASPSVLGGQAYVMVTSNYIAQILASYGVLLTDMDDVPTTPNESVVFRSDGTEVKEVESFFAYLSEQGTIPSRYDPSATDATTRFERMAFCP